MPLMLRKGARRWRRRELYSWGGQTTPLRDHVGGRRRRRHRGRWSVGKERVVTASGTRRKARAGASPPRLYAGPALGHQGGEYGPGRREDAPGCWRGSIVDVGMELPCVVVYIYTPVLVDARLCVQRFEKSFRFYTAPQ